MDPGGEGHVLSPQVLQTEQGPRLHLAVASATGSPWPSSEHRGQPPPPAGPRACAPRGDVTTLLTSKSQVSGLRPWALGGYPALPVRKPERNRALSQTLALQTRSCCLSTLQDGHSWHFWTLPCLRPCSPHRFRQPSGLLAMQLTPHPPPASWAHRGTKVGGEEMGLSNQTYTHAWGSGRPHRGDRVAARPFVSVSYSTCRASQERKRTTFPTVAFSEEQGRPHDSLVCESDTVEHLTVLSPERGPAADAHLHSGHFSASARQQKQPCAR